MKTTGLFDETMRLLRETDATNMELMAAVGVSQRWLSNLRGGKYFAPDVRPLQRLHDYLAAREVVVRFSPPPASPLFGRTIGSMLDPMGPQKKERPRV